MKNLPEKEKTYLTELLSVIKKDLGKNLAGVYLLGSASYGGYIPGRSDIDLQIVTKDSITLKTRKKLVSDISHDKIPCPGKKLEFVSYPFSAVNPVKRHPRFEINFNTGNCMDDHICFDYCQEPGHWFLLDIAMGRNSGTSLYGPSPTEIFGEVPEKWTIEAMLECIDWYVQAEPESPDLIINSCRCWRFVETGIMSSKEDGLQWALRQKGSPPVLESALSCKKAGKPINFNLVEEFISFIRKKLS